MRVVLRTLGVVVGAPAAVLSCAANAFARVLTRRGDIAVRPVEDGTPLIAAAVLNECSRHRPGKSVDN